MAKINLTNNMQAFTDEETFRQIYADCLDNAPFASDEIFEAHEKMKEWFNAYIAASDEYTFRYAYQCGYEAAMKEIMREGGVA